jgi:hypothetical protein
VPQELYEYVVHRVACSLFVCEQAPTPPQDHRSITAIVTLGIDAQALWSLRVEHRRATDLSPLREPLEDTLDRRRAQVADAVKRFLAELGTGSSDAAPSAIPRTGLVRWRESGAEPRVGG